MLRVLNAGVLGVFTRLADAFVLSDCIGCLFAVGTSCHGPAKPRIVITYMAPAQAVSTLADCQTRGLDRRGHSIQA